MAKLIFEPMLLQGEVMHARTLPKSNCFQYQNLYLYLPLKPKNKPKLGLLSFNKFNLFSFFDADHLLDQDQNKQEKNPDYNGIALAQLEKILQKNQINNIENIILVCHPRIMGYVFNPASFWLCFDKAENLIAVMVEVSNTFAQKHNYLLFNSSQKPITGKEWFEAKKEFHVSPFYKVEGDYKFRFVVSGERLDFYINYYVGAKLQLSTFLKCKYQKLNNWNLLMSLIKMPLLAFKTIFLIHLQAVKLWLFKKVTYYPLAKKLASNLTIAKNVTKQDF